MRRWPVVFILLAFKALASMESAHQEGQTFGKNLQNQASENVKNVDTKQVPGFQTDNPAQTGLSQNKNFSDAIRQELNNSETAKALMEISNQRQRYKLDPKVDPIFKPLDEKSAEILLDIKEEAGKAEKDIPYTITCEEGGEDVTYECFEDRKVTPQVPLKIDTLSINHIGFTEKKKAYYELVGGGKSSHHKRWELRYRPLGWASSLPKDIDAFRDVFCQNFSPKDVNTGTIYNINCSRIQSFKRCEPWRAKRRRVDPAAT